MFFKQLKAADAFLDLPKYGKTSERSSKLLRSTKELREDEDEEERERHDRETDSGTRLSVRSNKEDVDERSDNLPVTNILCGMETEEGHGKQQPPSNVEEKRFMIYICGGYKGKY